MIRFARLPTRSFMMESKKYYYTYEKNVLIEIV